MNKRMIIMISALAMLFGGIILFQLIKSFMIARFFKTYEAPPVTVSAVNAKLIDWQPRIKTVGNFVAMRGVEVNSQATGNVVRIFFDSGQYVEANAPLIAIDDTIDQASLKFTEADRVLKEISYKRQTELLKKGATSGSSVDEAKANLQQSQANVEKIEAQIKQKHISAPFSGQLGIRKINLGEYITPGTSQIVTLQSLDPLFLEFNLPEQMIKLIHIFQHIEFTVEAFPNVAFKGRISAINAKVDPTTHNILVQAIVANCPANMIQTFKSSNTHKHPKKLEIVSCKTDDNTKNKVQHFLFLPGMFADISIDLPLVHNKVVLPSTAISYSLYGDTVFKIIPNKHAKKDKKNREILTVKRVFIKKGEQEGNNTVILKGVNAGDLVVSSGEIKLKNDARVVINNSIKLDD